MASLGWLVVNWRCWPGYLGFTPCSLSGGQLGCLCNMVAAF